MSLTPPDPKQLDQWNRIITLRFTRLIAALRDCPNEKDIQDAQQLLSSINSLPFNEYRKPYLASMKKLKTLLDTIDKTR